MQTCAYTSTYMQSESYARDITTFQRINWRETSRETSFRNFSFVFSLPFFRSHLSFARSRRSFSVHLLQALICARKSYAEAVTRLFGKILSANIALQRRTGSVGIVIKNKRSFAVVSAANARKSRILVDEELRSKFSILWTVRFLRVFIHTAKISEGYLKNV